MKTANVFHAILLTVLVMTAAHATVGPERWLPGDDGIAASAGNQQSPAVTKGGETMLVVWSDGRSNPTYSSDFETAADIYGMRLDADGNPLETVPFPIAAGPAAQTNPQAAWNGSHWLVVYETQSLGGTGYYQKSLEAVRVSPDGGVIGAPVALTNLTPSTGMWAVASDGSNWVIAFEGTPAGYDIMALRLSAEGQVLDLPGRSLVPATYFLRFNVQLAYAGGVFLLTYSDNNDTRAVRFDSNLNLLDASPLLLATTMLSDMASNGSQFYLVWNGQLPDFSAAVLGSRVNTAGQLLDGGGDVISGNNPPQAYGVTQVVWDGVNWRVTWNYPFDGLSVARVSSLGEVLDPGGTVVTGLQTGAAAATANGGVMLAWTAYNGYNNDTVAGNITPDNGAGRTTTLSVGVPAQTRADVAGNGSGYLVAWRSESSAVNRVLVHPLDANGNPLGAEPIELASGDPLYGPGSPAVAWNGSVYLVSWGNSSGVVAQRLLPDGTRLDPAPILVMPSAFGPPDVAALGDSFLVAGRQYGSTPQVIYTVARRLRGSDGVVVDAANVFVGGYYVSRAPAVTVLGDRWFVVMHSNWTHDESNADTLGVFVNANGSIGPSIGLNNFSTAGGNGIFEIGLASNNSVALMVQSQEWASGVETDLVARMIMANGTLTPMQALTPWRGNQYQPRVAWDGSQFVVVYADQRNRFADLEQLDARADLFGMRIRADGTVIDPSGFAFSAQPGSEAFPNIAAGNGVSLLLGSFLRNQPGLGAYRIGYQAFGQGGNAWPTVQLTATPAGGDIPLAVDFASAGSGDSDGVILDYLWDFGDGTTAGSMDPTHVYTTPGPFVVTLAATDNAGAKAANTALVSATAPNQPPVAMASASPSTGPAPLNVTFYATGSYDPDGAIGNFEWRFSDGSLYYGNTAYYTFYSPGTHTATLKVYDVRGGVGSAAVSVVVSDPGSVPPLPPSDLTYWLLTATSADLHWRDNSSNETGFILERCLGTLSLCAPDSVNWVALATTAADNTSHNDTGLTPGTAYSWRVKAFNALGSSAYSNILSVTTLTLPPAPSNLRAQARLIRSRAMVRLAWKDNASDETGYTVERCAGSACSNFAAIAYLPVNYVSYTDAGVARAATYRYRVTASGNGGNSAYSNIATVTTP